MTRRNRRIEALNDAGFDVIRDGHRLWVEGGRPDLHGFTKRFKTLKAACRQLFDSTGRAKLVPVEDTVAVVDLDYREKGDARKDGHVIAHVKSEDAAREFCKEFGYQIKEERTAL